MADVLFTAVLAAADDALADLAATAGRRDAVDDPALDPCSYWRARPGR